MHMLLMGTSIFLLIVSCLTLAMYCVWRSFQEDRRNFDENKKKAVVEIVGYDRKSGNSFTKTTWDFLVKFIDNDEVGNDCVFLCCTGGVRSEDYPVGSKINVWYAKEKWNFVHIETEELVRKHEQDKQR